MATGDKLGPGSEANAASSSSRISPSRPASVDPSEREDAKENELRWLLAGRAKSSARPRSLASHPRLQPRTSRRIRCAEDHLDGVPFHPGPLVPLGARRLADGPHQAKSPLQSHERSKDGQPALARVGAGVLRAGLRAGAGSRKSLERGTDVERREARVSWA